MRFSPRFLDDLRDRVALGDLVSRKVKLARAGRDLKGLCPFHNEKTPSFHIVEDKNFYHCFGCGAHGDAISWLTETEGLSFPEAVEELARMAGVPLPKPDPKEEKRAKQAADLHDVLEAATRWFERQLGGQAGVEARRYLNTRGLSPHVIGHFRLGYAPESYDALRDAMRAQGVEDAKLVEVGLLKASETGKKPYSYFRNRIIFPITDRQGRVIAFGGRTLEKDNPAKYLNSPETPLFHKGRTLYNLAGARKPAYDAGTVIVVEGYMDVIALAKAGFANAVAPLGTAVTEEQLEVLWRMAPEPILCMDGDQAGIRAAGRAADRALPLLKPGLSLRFALLSDGLDPDDLLKRDGPGAFQKVLDGAQPLSELLWNLQVSGIDAKTPEQRAGLEKKIISKVFEIKDEKVRSFYMRDFKDRIFRTFILSKKSGKRPARRHQRGFIQPQGALSASDAPGASGLLKMTRLARSTLREDLHLYEQMICLYAINHPMRAEGFVEELATLDFNDAELDKLRQELLVTLGSAQGLDHKTLKGHLAKDGFEDIVAQLDKSPLLQKTPWLWPDADDREAERSWRHVMARLRRLALQREIGALETAYRENGSDDILRQLIQLQREFEQAEGTEAELETVIRSS